MAAARPCVFQFTLTALLALMVVAASAMSLWGAEVGAFVVIGLVVALFVIGRVTRLEGIVIVIVMCMLGSLLLPATTCDHAEYYAHQCKSRLTAVAQAIKGYHATHGQFPPACIRDKNGRPMHSWRVLILPQLGYKTLYAAYRFDEPWNGPNNSALLASIPREYKCPALVGRHGRGGVTTCAAVVGPETAWPDDRPMRQLQLRDGPEQTILIGDVAPDLAIQWLEPRDVAFASATEIHRMAWAGSNKVDQLIAVHPWPFGRSNDMCIAHIVTADGTVRALPENVRPDKLRALLTAAGGEPINIEAVVARPTSKVGKTVAAVLLVISSTVVVVSVVRHRRMQAMIKQTVGRTLPDATGDADRRQSSGTA